MTTTIGREWLNATRPCPCDGDWAECPYCQPDLVFTSDGPNRCTCGCSLDGTDYWDDGEGMPFATCGGCGLHYVVEADGIGIYATCDGDVELTGTVAR